MNPLPIVYSDEYGDCLFIDNSTLEYLDTCPRSMEYYYIQKRQFSEERNALNFGGGIHAALAERYGAPSEYQDFVSGSPLEDAMNAKMDQYFEQHPLGLGDFRQPDVAKKLIAAYNAHYQSEKFSVLEQGGKPLVEFPFAFKLATMEYDSSQHSIAGHPKQRLTWFYIGRIDMVVSEENQIFTVDHKTTSMMGNGFWMEQRVNPQHEGYCWAWWKATGQLPAGYIVNGIRTRKPLIRDEASVSKRSTRKDIEADDFQRDKVFIDLPRIMEWEFNLKKKLKTFLNYYSDSYFPLHRKWCVGKYGACQYYDVCSLAAEFREATLSSGNFQDVVWSPLEKKEGEVSPKPDPQHQIDWANLMKEEA